MMLDMKAAEFLEILSSKEPVPGGGGASAAAGAMGAALGLMVANLTLGKKRYQDAEEKICTCSQKLISLRDRLMVLVDEDAKAFEPLSRAYGLPKDTEEERLRRESVMEEALLAASLTPLEIMETIYEVMEQLKMLGTHGSRLAISDVGAGVLLSQASLESASLNIYINTKMMKNKGQASVLNEKADRLIQKSKELREEIYENVVQVIR